MHRFYTPNQIEDSGVDSVNSGGFPRRISLDDRVARQIRTVLRGGIGDRIRLFDGTGSEWECEIASIDRSDVTVDFVSVVEPIPEPTTRVTMLLGLARPERMELAIQKCTELGAVAFIPVLSERVQGGATGTPSENRLDRWQRIAIEAAEQCGRVTVPIVEPPVTVMEAVADQARQRPLLCLWEAQSAELEPLSQVLRSGELSNEFAVLIGPPGGFSADEATAVQAVGAKLVTLGPRVLRSETAAITALSAILYEMGDLGGRAADTGSNA